MKDCIGGVVAKDQGMCWIFATECDLAAAGQKGGVRAGHRQGQRAGLERGEEARGPAKEVRRLGPVRSDQGKGRALLRTLERAEAVALWEEMGVGGENGRAGEGVIVGGNGGGER